MKRILTIAFAICALYSCKDTTRQENDLRNEIFKIHDKIMAKDETVMKSKNKLDSLLKTVMKDTAEKTNVKGIELRLTAAGEAMENWMNKFQVDVTGKSHDEVMKYYADQKKQVTAIDSQINVAVKEADQYLSTHKIK